MSDLFPRMVDIVPEGSAGPVSVDHFDVTDHDSKMSMILGHNRLSWVEPGRYARLMRGGHRLLMSDTTMERWTNVGFTIHARGDVLVAGLGLGMILWPAMANAKVRSITVVESDPDVLALVVPSLTASPGYGKVTFVGADIMTWAPPREARYDCVYFDIWSDITTENLPEMGRLHRKYARSKAPGAWVGSWLRDYLTTEHRSGYR